MTLWRRARKGERCGFCLDLVFKGGEPIMLYGAPGLTRCANCATSRYGVDVPVPFPDPEPPALPQFSRKPEFVGTGQLARSSRWADLKQRQTGEGGE